MSANALIEFPVAMPETPDAASDQQLIAALNTGDADAFEPLYRRYRDWVVALAHRFTGDESLALDVMQETFLYLLKKFPGFRLTAQMKTFLYPAVKNLSIAARRKTSRVQSTEAEQQHLAATARRRDCTHQLRRTLRRARQLVRRAPRSSAASFRGRSFARRNRGGCCDSPWHGEITLASRAGNPALRRTNKRIFRTMKHLPKQISTAAGSDQPNFSATIAGFTLSLNQDRGTPTLVGSIPAHDSRRCRLKSAFRFRGSIRELCFRRNLSPGERVGRASRHFV
jgi:RNA polymerase sigma factor (sigma-70 family)